MAQATVSYYQLNRGLVSKLGLARVDIKRTAMSAEVMSNFMPRVLGSMMLRPGQEFLGYTHSGGKAVFLDFVFSTDDVALVELTDRAMRVWIDDAPLERPSVTTVVVNGDFPADLSGWTASGGVTWVSAGRVSFIGDGTTDETLDQTVSVATGDQLVVHALRIVVTNGPLKLRVGSSVGLDDYIEETTLGTGTHSLAFTPLGVSFSIRFFSPLLREILLASCNVEPAGIMRLPTPWIEADLYSVRFDQSGDVLFVACSGNDGDNYQQRRIERRANDSWSIILYQTTDGPYRVENVGPITITPSGPSGNITLAASADLWTPDNVGGLYSITQQGQFVAVAASSDNTFTDPVQVQGVEEQRGFAISILGTWMGTVTLQRSIGAPGNWTDFETYTANITAPVNDGLDNQIVFYRLGFKSGEYTSGTANLSIDYDLGRIRGVVRITAYNSTISVDAEVLHNLGANLVATDIWSEGSWSDRRGWPTAVSFYEGRLWWTGKNGIFGSVSDAFDDYSPDIDGTAGAAGTINRTIGSGPVDDINWLLPLQRLIIGAEGTEFSARSTAFDEPLTPTNFNIKGATTQGSANVNPVKIDSRGAFVQRSGTRVYELAYSGETNDYAVTDMTAIVPEVGNPGIVMMAVQRQPDTRIHCVRSDGVVAVAVIDRVENVLSWQLVERDDGGEVEDVVVLPGTVEDQVYYAVRLPPTTGLTLSRMWDLQSTVNLHLQHPDLGGGLSYVVGDELTVVGGTFTRAARVVVAGIRADGIGTPVAYAMIDCGDYTVIPAGLFISLSGGSGTGANMVAQWGGAAQIIPRQNTGVLYTEPPDLSFTGGGGSGGEATASLQVVGLQRDIQGTGYTVGDLITLIGGIYENPAVAEVVEVGAFFGEIKFARLMELGSYSVLPPEVPGYSGVYEFLVAGGTGSGARFYVTIGVGGATVTEQGDYATAPTVVVTGDGAGATFTASVEPVPGLRTLVKWAKESECVGGTLNKQADFFVLFEPDDPTTVVTGLDHLEDREVIVWADGADLSPDDEDTGVQRTYLVEDGTIQLDVAVSQAVVGLPYHASWQSTKLAFAGDGGSWLNQRKKVSQLGLIMADTHSQGIKYGPDFDTLDPLPKMEDSEVVPYDRVWEQFDFDMMEFPGGWNTDSRICLQCRAPRPCTVLAITMALEEHGGG